MQDVSINGVSLLSVSRKIVIHDVSESAPTFAYTAADRVSGVGQYVTGRKTQFKDIIVKFAIADKRKDDAERGLILNAVSRWMISGEDLRCSDRYQQHIHVKPLTFPARPNSHAWNQDYTIAFRSYHPYWVSDRIAFHGTKSGEITHIGMIPSPITVDGVTTSSTVLIRLDNEFMKFAGVAQGATFELRHDDEDRVIARCNNTSCMHHLDPTSNDILRISYGLHTITISGLKNVNISSEVRTL